MPMLRIMLRIEPSRAMAVVAPETMTIATLKLRLKGLEPVAAVDPYAVFVERIRASLRTGEALLDDVPASATDFRQQALHVFAHFLRTPSFAKHAHRSEELRGAFAAFLASFPGTTLDDIRTFSVCLETRASRRTFFMGTYLDAMRDMSVTLRGLTGLVLRRANGSVLDDHSTLIDLHPEVPVLTGWNVGAVPADPVRFYHNTQTTLYDPVHEISADRLIVLDGYAFDITELTARADADLAQFYINPHLQGNSFQPDFSDEAKQVLRTHPVLREYAERFDEQLRVQSEGVDPEIIDKVIEMLRVFAAQGAGPVSENAREVFIAFKLSLSETVQEKLDNFLVMLPSLHGGTQNKLFKDVLQDSCIQAQQLFLWQFVVQVRPAAITTIPQRVINLGRSPLQQVEIRTLDGTPATAPVGDVPPVDEEDHHEPAGALLENFFALMMGMPGGLILGDDMASAAAPQPQNFAVLLALALLAQPFEGAPDLSGSPLPGGFGFAGFGGAPWNRRFPDADDHDHAV